MYKRNNIPIQFISEEELKVKTLGVWCCSYRYKCRWQSINMIHGLAWGTVEDALPEWRKWHDKECNGKLIQLLEKKL